MPAATPFLTDALARARADWLAGDPSAWARYAECLAQLEHHIRDRITAEARPVSRPTAHRPAYRTPRGQA
jgi:hypothetical protein